MILFTVSTIEILILVVIGLLLVALIGVGLIHYAKIKMEEEVENIEDEVKSSSNQEQIKNNTKAILEDEVVETIEEEPKKIETYEEVESLDELEEFNQNRQEESVITPEPMISVAPIKLEEIEKVEEQIEPEEISSPIEFKEEVTELEPVVELNQEENYEDLEKESYDMSQEEEEDEKTGESLSEIELLLREMQADLENQDKNIHTFEEEQEEKAIISYQELKAKKEDPSLLDEVEMFEQEQEETAVSNIEEKPEVKPKQTFSNSEFISPVYGRMKNPEPTYPKIPNFREEFHIERDEDKLQFDDVKVNLNRQINQSFEDTFNIAPMSDETKSSEEFLQALKDFRNNLE